MIKTDVDELEAELLREIEKKPVQYRIGIDTFERAKANMSKTEILACCKFNIDKYCWRQKKQDIEDFQKIKDYCDLAIETLRGE